MDTFTFKEAGERCILCKGKAANILRDGYIHKFTLCPACGEYVTTAVAAGRLEHAPAETVHTYVDLIKTVPLDKILWIQRSNDPNGSVEAVVKDRR